MTTHELFTLMYFALDAKYEETKDDALGAYVGSLNPFLWEDGGSADPAYFIEFSQYMNDKKIGEDYAYEHIKIYLSTNNYDKYFTVSKEDWIKAAKEYLGY